MSWGWTWAGTIGQLMLGYFLFMLVVFAGGGVANGRPLDKLQLRVLDLSMYVLPGTCALSAALVLYLQWHGGSARSYGWHAVPLAATALYLTYVRALVRRT